MKVSFDLDSVIFDLNPLMARAFVGSDCAYFYPTDWNIAAVYPEPIAQKMEYLFGDDLLYTTPLLDKEMPNILNSLMRRSDIKVCFVTERRKKQPLKTFRQLNGAGIRCSLNQVYDEYGAKADVLERIGVDLHFDDYPLVVAGCLEKHIPIVMISNPTTPYNHHLLNTVEHYADLRTALMAKGLYNQK